MSERARGWVGGPSLSHWLWGKLLGWPKNCPPLLWDQWGGLGAPPTPEVELCPPPPSRPVWASSRTHRYVDDL